MSRTAAEALFHVAGIDEAGRGPLAGPVVAAAVVLDPARPIKGLADSKQLTAARREALSVTIRERALAFSVAVAEVEEIDRINILQATLLAMQRAYESLSLRAELALVDGNQPPRLPCRVVTVIGGDASEPAISAASILAKVHRDGLMIQLHDRHPQYGFADHKGYPTGAHVENLMRYGPCECHRQSFGPVRKAALIGR